MGTSTNRQATSTKKPATKRKATKPASKQPAAKTKSKKARAAKTKPKRSKAAKIESRSKVDRTTKQPAAKTKSKKARAAKTKPKRSKAAKIESRSKVDRTTKQNSETSRSLFEALKRETGAPNREALARFVEHAARDADDDAILVEAAHEWSLRPAWLVAFIEVLAAEPSAADLVAREFARARLSKIAADVGDHGRVKTLARDAPSGARALAIAALLMFPTDEDYEPIVVAALTDATAHPRVIEAAARLANKCRIAGAAVGDAAQVAYTQWYEHEPTQDALLALLMQTQRVLGGKPRLVAGTNISSFADMCRTGWRGPFFHGDLVAIGVDRTMACMPKSDRMTEENEYGVVVLGAGVARYHAAPVRFPIRPDHANGGLRAVYTIGVFDRRLVLGITTPFDEQYLLGCDLHTGAWVAYADSALTVDRTLDQPCDESDLPVTSWAGDVGEAGWVERPLGVDEQVGTDLALDEALAAELAEAWAGYDAATCVHLRVATFGNARVARIKMDREQAVVWLGPRSTSVS